MRVIPFVLIGRNDSFYLLDNYFIGVLKIIFMSDFNPETALVIILGADKWPDCPTIQAPSEPFKNSAHKIKEYFLNNFCIRTTNLVYLFNEEGVEQIVNKIHDFLEDRISSATDLFIYYVGHGIEHTNNDYYLLLRSTSEERLIASALSINSLIDAIRVTEHLRRYIILDACFSGLAINHLSPTLKDTLLFSSSNKEKSSYSRGENDCTMFTGALYEILTRYGDNFLSFDKLKFFVSSFIEKKYAKPISPQLNTINQQANDIRHLPIFHNNAKRDGFHGNNTISWHITTSSKGGVGKTLLALLLTALYTAKNKSPLIIDLNGVNADLKRLLGRENAEFSTETEEEQLVLAKIEQNNEDYFLGWLTNPFIMHNAQSFFDFLLTVRDEYVQKIKREFNREIDTIIVDTNYHFCNIFSNNDGDYDRFPFWEKDSFYIYFIWVYRQIQNLALESENAPLQEAISKEIQIVEDTAIVVEKHLSSQLRHLNNPTTPFIHVINPVLIQEASGNEVFRALLKTIPSLFTGKKQQKVKEIPELKELAVQEASGDSHVDFRKMQNMMKKAQHDVGESNFLKMLQQLKNNYGNTNRPFNFFPIYSYHEELLSYQNKYWELSKIRDFQVYEVFKKLLEGI